MFYGALLRAVVCGALGAGIVHACPPRNARQPWAGGGRVVASAAPTIEDAREALLRLLSGEVDLHEKPNDESFRQKQITSPESLKELRTGKPELHDRWIYIGGWFVDLQARKFYRVIGAPMGWLCKIGGTFRGGRCSRRHGR